MFITVDSNNLIIIPELIETLTCIDPKQWCINKCNCATLTDEMSENTNQLYYDTPISMCRDISAKLPKLNSMIHFVYLDASLMNHRYTRIINNLKNIIDPIVYIITDGMQIPNEGIVYVINTKNFHRTIIIRFLRLLLETYIGFKKLYSVRDLVNVWAKRAFVLPQHQIEPVMYVDLSKFVLTNNEALAKKPSLIDDCDVCT